MSATGHVPVMLREVLAALAPRDGELHVDGTFGAGGYTQAILEAADCRVIAIDRDPEAVARGHLMARRFPGRLTILHGRFSELARLVGEAGISEVDGVALDLGISSYQLDTAERGFSFAADGPLDMRMSDSGETAAELIDRLDERELADVIWRYGEERRSRAVARAIVRARAQAPIQRTGELAALVAGAVGGREKIHPATRTFQALRIAVNAEIDELQDALRAAERLLLPGGRLVVVSFHSLEDREVKQFLAARSGRRPRGSRHLPETGENAPAASFRLIRSGAMRPVEDETATNPRARSARLRAAVRTEAPALEAA